MGSWAGLDALSMQGRNKAPYSPVTLILFGRIQICLGRSDSDHLLAGAYTPRV
jgi:hypothetical protein